MPVPCSMLFQTLYYHLHIHNSQYFLLFTSPKNTLTAYFSEICPILSHPEPHLESGVFAAQVGQRGGVRLEFGHLGLQHFQELQEIILIGRHVVLVLLKKGTKRYLSYK